MPNNQQQGKSWETKAQHKITDLEDQQKEEVKCYCCCHLKGTGKACTHPFGHIMKCRHCEHCVNKPESMVTTLVVDETNYDMEDLI